MYEVEQTLEELLSKEPPAPYKAHIFADPKDPSRLCIVGTFTSVWIRSNAMGNRGAIVLGSMSNLTASLPLCKPPRWAIDGGLD